MIVSTMRKTGDLAGVFEYDGDTGYFYLYNLREQTDQKVIGAIWILNGTPDFQEREIDVVWDPSETVVGLLIRGRLCAVHDTRNTAKYGGDYRFDRQPAIPKDVTALFESGNILGRE